MLVSLRSLNLSDLWQLGIPRGLKYLIRKSVHAHILEESSTSLRSITFSPCGIQTTHSLMQGLQRLQRPVNIEMKLLENASQWA